MRRKSTIEINQCIDIISQLSLKEKKLAIKLLKFFFLKSLSEDDIRLILKYNIIDLLDMMTDNERI